MQSEISSLQEQAKFLHESCQLEQALPLYKQLYSLALSTNFFPSEFLDDYADLCTTLGDLETAEKLYLQSIEMYPKTNPAKYFSYAQISTGQKSVNLYLKGISICSANEKSQVACAYSALTEIYMTDLW